MKTLYAQLACILLACGALACPESVESSKDDAGLKPVVQATSSVPQVVEPPPTIAKPGLLAIPAWSAVHHRDELLARRGDAGWVWGALISAGKNFYLVDQVEGGGTLSIPIVFSKDAIFKKDEEVSIASGLPDLPLMVAVYGSWSAFRGQGWHFRVHRVEPYSAVSKNYEMKVARRFAIVHLAPPTEVRSLKEKRGGASALQFYLCDPRLHSRPSPDNGRFICDNKAGQPLAVLLLPGEASAYGDQARLAENEKFKLKQQLPYWIALGAKRYSSFEGLPVFKGLSPPYLLPKRSQKSNK